MKFVRKKYVRNFHIILFVYGLAIALLTNYINYQINLEDMKKDVLLGALEDAERIDGDTLIYIKDIEYALSAIKNSVPFREYSWEISRTKSGSSDLFLAEKERAVNNLLLTILDTHIDYLQVRYIDSEGKERVRAERDRKNGTIFLVSPNELQDKSDRYYFKKTSLLKKGDFWYSPIDPNVERGRIEEPIRPTIRVATPVYEGIELNGVIVINVDVEPFLDNLDAHMEGFDVYIADEEGHVIEDSEGNFVFSRYLGKEPMLADFLPKIDRSNWKIGVGLFYDGVVHSLKLPVSGKCGLSLVLVPKDSLYERLGDGLLEDFHRFALIILLISLPLAFLLAIPASRIHRGLVEAEEENERHINNLMRCSRTDALTMLGNRYAIDEMLDIARASYDRYHRPFSALLIDIDRFKLINDTYGHLVGDYVLQTVSELIKEHVRQTDFPGRWGGEEFIVLCEDTELEDAIEVADKVLKMVRGHEFEELPPQSVSIGVAQFGPDDDVQTFLKRLDDALYEAKETGRDKVVFR